jgi:hypothetical protein
VLEHRIRLRGGWERRAIDAPEPVTQRLTLPTRWDPDRPGRWLLTRRFRRPPLDPDCQLVLLLEQVPGIHSLLLNGQAPTRVSPAESRFEVPLGSLPDRNVLVLEIDTTAATDPAGVAVPEWGSIALVLRTPGPAAGR